MGNLFSSSIGKKIIMSVTGSFLCVFLLVHLGINSLLLLNDGGQAFNIAAHFMVTNPLIKVMEITLFGGFILHMIYAMIVSIQNLISRPKKYKVTGTSEVSVFSKFMLHTSVIIGIFLVVHMMHFYFKAKMGGIDTIVYDEVIYKDMASLVNFEFQSLTTIIIYIISFIVLGFHLHHGFQSAFQTAGVNHSTYTPIIKKASTLYSIVISLGFIAIAVIIHLIK